MILPDLANAMDVFFLTSRILIFGQWPNVLDLKQNNVIPFLLKCILHFFQVNSKINPCCLTLAISYFFRLCQPLFLPCLFEKV